MLSLVCQPHPFHFLTDALGLVDEDSNHITYDDLIGSPMESDGVSYGVGAWPLDDRRHHIFENFEES